MTLDAFDFTLPEDRIALRPARPRDSARLMQVRADAITDHGVRDLPRLLRAGDLMVFNDTRVIHAALDGVRPARDPGGQDVAVQANLHKRVDDRCWRAFARPGKRLKPDDRIVFGDGLEAIVVEKGEGGDLLLRFTLDGAGLDAAIAAAGHAPLPPYIADRRAPDAADEDDYQTIFARKDGSVAAPTAGLHFTDALVAALDTAGVERAFVTLHVGAGTFLPVKTDDPSAHVMHSEWRHVSVAVAAKINAAKREGRRVIAIGTTALRTLESAVDDTGAVQAVAGETDIFITPGFRFQVCDGLWTNFHLPKSTLFMLVCAFAGTHMMQQAYRQAISSGYRFYSYGDASLLWRAYD
jgi:S-adenosylmethionine:tRNA ribosyltransferase-isomerase